MGEGEEQNPTKIGISPSPKRVFPRTPFPLSLSPFADFSAPCALQGFRNCSQDPSDALNCSPFCFATSERLFGVLLHAGAWFG